MFPRYVFSSISPRSRKFTVSLIDLCLSASEESRRRFREVSSPKSRYTRRFSAAKGITRGLLVHRKVNLRRSESIARSARENRAGLSRVRRTRALILLRITLLHAATGGRIVSLNQNALYAMGFLPCHFSARIMQNVEGK